MKTKKSNTMSNSSNTDYDWGNTPWFKRRFSHPERTIRIATSFSGIGAAEYALKRLGLKHEIVFACDNGERYLKFRYPRLAEIAKGLSCDDKKNYAEFLLKANRPKINSLTFENIYNNLFVECTDTRTELELAKECIDLVTKELSYAETMDYVNGLYESTKKKNHVKESYMANYELDEKNWHNDIRFLDGSQYKGMIDLYVGGSPCQSYSQSGKRLGLEDTRGTLFYDFAKVIKECEPKVFIYENVKGMATHDNGNSWDVVRGVFESLGYDIHYKVLNSKDYNVPQNRERLFCIGFKKETEFLFPVPVKQQHTIADLLIDKTQGTVRQLTPREDLRYMGFDDHFKQVVANHVMTHQCGNSIVVDVFMAIYKQMDITQYGVVK